MHRNKLTIKDLSPWHQKMLAYLSNAPFGGNNEIKNQLSSSLYGIIDKIGSLSILTQEDAILAPVTKTIPVEAWAKDKDGIIIQVLLFTRKGRVYMLEILRVDSNPVIDLPPVDQFEIVILTK